MLAKFMAKPTRKSSLHFDVLPVELLRNLSHVPSSRLALCVAVSFATGSVLSGDVAIKFALH